MNATYKYPPTRIIFPYAVFLIIPFVSAIIWFTLGLAKHGLLFNSIYWAFNLLIGIPVICWIVDNISVRIAVDDTSITLKSIFRNLKFYWQDLESLHWKILYEGRQVSQEPSDFIIKFKTGQKIYVYSIIQKIEQSNKATSQVEESVIDFVNTVMPGSAFESKDGISHLESFILLKVPSLQGSKDQQIKSGERRQVKLAVLAGILLFAFGLCAFYRPIPPNKEKLWFITKRIGMSADAIFLMIGGVVLAGWGVSRLNRDIN